MSGVIHNRNSANFQIVVRIRKKDVNMASLQNEVREKLKKSDALKFFKEISQTMSKEEFKEFSDVAMKSAYDKNRVKAVEYMLSFYEPNNPLLLLQIHLQIMLNDSKAMQSGKEMLKVLIKNFSDELCNKVMNDFIEYHKGKPEFKQRQKEISKIILEEKMAVNNTAITKRPKI